MARAWRQYTVLGLLFAWVCFYEGGSIAWLVSTLLHPADTVTAPFSIRNATRIIGSSPFFGDEILSLNGEPFTAKYQLDRALASAHPGDRMRLVLSEPSGRAIEKTIVLQSLAREYSSARTVAVLVCMGIFIPVVCLGLGFLVAFIRPRDGNAWLLLLLMAGFSGLVGDTDWFSPVPDLQLLWSAFCNCTWPLSMVLFSISFPSRFDWDRRYPWARYCFLLPAAAVQVTQWAILFVWVHDVAAAERLHGIYTRLALMNLLVDLLGVSIFFVVLGIKSGTVMPPDEKRRMRILRTGASIALGPMGLLALYALIRDRDLMFGVPWPIQTTALMMMALFPVTLAYVIVVQRAMDLGFVIRQSVKYGLARGSLWLLRAALLGLAIYVFSSHLGQRFSGWFALLAIAGLVVVRRRNTDRASVWIDRRFFREAYNTEAVLGELAGEVGRYLETGPLVENVAQRVPAILHVPDVVVLLREGEVFRTRYSTRPGEPMDIPASGNIAAVLRERTEPLDVYFDKPPEWIRTLNAEEIQTLDFMRTQLLLPIPGKDQLAGIMSLGPKLSEAAYSTTDRRLLRAVTMQMGMALENSRLMASLAEASAQREVINRELEIAREVQERLFPQNFPKIEGVDCFGYCRPARGVGGDYYDFIELPEGRLGIAIGDVSGKGIAAALLMASLQASLRGQTMAGVHDLAGLMRNVNKLVYDASQSNRYATFFYAEFNPSTKELVFVNAGHNPPLILRGSEVIRLEACGPVVGLLPGVGYTMDSCRLQPGDIFVGYTDGISEAMNEQDEEWEEERFIAAARQVAAGSSKEMIDGVFRQADAFTGAAKQYDDMTLLVMKLAS